MAISFRNERSKKTLEKKLSLLEGAILKFLKNQNASELFELDDKIIFKKKLIDFSNAFIKYEGIKNIYFTHFIIH